MRRTRPETVHARPRTVRIRLYAVTDACPDGTGTGLEVAAPSAWQAILAASPAIGSPPEQCFAVPV